VHCAGCRILLLSLAATTAAFIGGCTAAGVASDVVGSSIETTQQLFHAGKADTFINANWYVVIAAARRAGDKLKLHIQDESPHPDQLKLRLCDDRKQKVTITIVRRTETTTELRVDVGLFGPEGLGRLVLRAIAQQLPKSITDVDLRSAKAAGSGNDN